jgi:hypothetical protein
METIMKIAAVVTLAALLLVAGFFVFQSDKPVQAQAKGFEYGYIVKVSRAESYDLEVERWAAQPKDKQYLASHVFIYETGENIHIERLNSLNLMNKLAADGWEVVDLRDGLIRRAK